MTWGLYRDLVFRNNSGRLPDFLKHEISMISQKEFQISQSPLAISVTATQRIVDAVKAFGFDNRFPEQIALLLKEAQEQGLGNNELAALIGVIRSRRSQDLQDRA
ncbi:MAG: hypothetical protein AB2L20_08510 [Mangrovibacterium sp.]